MHAVASSHPALGQSEASMVMFWPMRGQQTDQLQVYHLLHTEFMQDNKRWSI